jgi:hypothetical protein
MTPSNLSTLVENLRLYNAWRRGSEDIEQPHPKNIGEWIDSLCTQSLQLEKNLALAKEYLKKIQAEEGRVDLSELHTTLQHLEPQT